MSKKALKISRQLDKLLNLYRRMPNDGTKLKIENKRTKLYEALEGGETICQIKIL